MTEIDIERPRSTPWELAHLRTEYVATYYLLHDEVTEEVPEEDGKRKTFGEMVAGLINGERFTRRSLAFSRAIGVDFRVVITYKNSRIVNEEFVVFGYGPWPLREYRFARGDHDGIWIEQGNELALDEITKLLDTDLATRDAARATTVEERASLPF